MRTTPEEMNALFKKRREVLSHRPVTFYEASYDVLMYRWYDGIVSTCMDGLDQLKYCEDLSPEDKIIAIEAFFRARADYFLDMMKGLNDGQRESDHN